MASAIQSKNVLVSQFRAGKGDWYSMLGGPHYTDFTVTQFEEILLTGGFTLIAAIKDVNGIEYTCSKKGLELVE